MNQEKKELLESRKKKLKDAQDAHYYLSAKLKMWHNFIGIPIIVFTVFVGSALFADLQDSSERAIKIVMGIIAVVAAVLASIQTFLKLPERANIHRTMAIQLGFLKKDLAELIAMPPTDESQLDEKLINIRRRWDEIISEAPTIPNGLWKKIKQRHNVKKKKDNSSV